MPVCKCGEPVTPERVAVIGKVQCVACGQAAAEVEIKAKSTRIAPAFNKGGYVYLGDAVQAVKAMKDAGRKDPNLNTVDSGTITGRWTSNVPPVVEVRKRRRVIGVVYKARSRRPADGRDALMIYEGDAIPPDMIDLRKP